MTLQTILRGLVQRFGTGRVKRWLWNREYGQGRWDCLDTMAGDYIYPHVEQYARHGNILDLGCGPGAVGNELNAAAYLSYTGIDISDAAIERATQKNLRGEQNCYLQGDIRTYAPKGSYDVILFGDSIYYFRSRLVPGILRRYSGYLKPDGVLIVRSWVSHHRSRGIMRGIERDFGVVERHLYHDSKIVVLVLRPRPVPAVLP